MSAASGSGFRPTRASGRWARCPYGEVYGRYYAAYLSMIEDQTFPQALREAAQAYMNGL